MTDITREELRSDLRTVFKEVLTDSEIIESVFHPIISKIVIEKMTDKFERTFGINCMDHEEREATRKRMEFLDETYVWAKSEEGIAAIEAFKKLMKVVDFAASSAVRGIVYFMFAGVVTLIALGVAMHKSVKALFGF